MITIGDPYPPYAIELARQLRKRATPAEKALWIVLGGKKLEWLKFRRQHRIQNYIVDFYCHELNLVVEIEGSIHEEEGQRGYDEVRFEIFESLGLIVMRISNERVLKNTTEMLREIVAFKPSPRSPLPRERGR